MRHVLEKLNYANRSMKHKLVIYMAAMGLLLAAVLLVSLPSIAPKLPGEIREFLSDWFRGDSHSPPPGWKLRWIPTGTAMGSTVLPALMLPVKTDPHGAELLPVAFSAQLFNGGECQALASPELLEA